MPKPHRTVVVCVHNRPRPLETCLESVLASLPPGDEVLVVDDASDDETPAVLAAWAARHPDTLRTVRNDRQRGVSGARNVGARAARGDLVLFTDSDCVVERGWVEALTAPFADPAVVATAGLVVEPLERNLAEKAAAGTTRIGRPGQGRRLVGCNMSFRRRTLLEQPFDEALTYYADEDEMAWRLSECGHRFAFVPDARVLHYHGMTTSSYLRTGYHMGRGVGRYLYKRNLWVGRDVWPLLAAAATLPLAAVDARLAWVPALFASLQVAMLYAAERWLKGKGWLRSLQVLPLQLAFYVAKLAGLAAFWIGLLTGREDDVRRSKREWRHRHEVGRREGGGGVLLLVLVLVVLAVLKALYDPGLGRNSLDGGFYYQIARHVAAGDGLQTSVSLYHQGLRELPHPTNAPPLWPLVLGGAGRLGGLYPSAVLLPELLYLAALALLYPLVNRTVARLGGDPVLLRRGARLDVGHLTVLWFGLNPVLFNFTSLPYTEALALCLLFSTLLVVDGVARRPSAFLAAAAGVLAAGAFLTRIQMLGLAVAVAGCLVLATWRDRRYGRTLAAFAAAAAATVLPWLLFLAGWMRPFRLRAVIGLGAYREIPELEPFRFSVPVAGRWDWLLDRLGGLLVAFDPLDRYSYAASFGPVALAVPLVLAAAVVHGLRSRGQRTFGPVERFLLPLCLLAAGLLVLAPVHMTHAIFFLPWLFGFRHGLPFVLLVVAAVAWAQARGGRWLRIATLGLLVASTPLAAVRTWSLVRDPPVSGLRGAEPALVAWLSAHDEPPTVLTTESQSLAIFSDAGFHWLDCSDQPEQVRRLFRHAGVDYLLVYAGEERCRFARDLPELELVHRFGTRGATIWVLGPAGGEGNEGP